MEGRESPLSCYFVDHAQPPQKFNTDNPNLRGTPCDPNGLRPSQLYTFNQRDLRDDESTRKLRPFALSVVRPPGLHTRSRSARIGHGLGEQVPLQRHAPAWL